MYILSRIKWKLSGKLKVKRNKMKNEATYILEFAATKNVKKHTFLINSHSHPQSGESLGWRRGA